MELGYYIICTFCCNLMKAIAKCVYIIADIVE